MPYTFRNENEFLPAGRRRGGPAAPADTYGDAFGEYPQYVALGVDAVFSDDPDTALSRHRRPARRTDSGRETPVDVAPAPRLARLVRAHHRRGR